MGRLIDTPLQPGEKLRLLELEGIIAVFHPRVDSRSVTARWKKGELHVTMPAGMGRYSVVKSIVSMKDRILSRRPSLKFSPGQELHFDGMTVTIKSQSLHPLKILMQGSGSNPVILIGNKIDLDSDECSAIVSRLMCHAAGVLAPGVLLPRAKEIATRLGVKVESWKISRGHRQLGCCTGRKTIALSSVLMFLPQELRDYIVYHELAHVTHMDHSPDFHRLCDRYCGGREKELILKLKHFKWPIIKQ